MSRASLAGAAATLGVPEHPSPWKASGRCMTASEDEHPPLEKALLDNSLSFLYRGADGAANAYGVGDSQGLAFAVADLAVAIELLLKARLAREHWTLVVSNLEGASLDKLRRGDVKTVTPEQAEGRLASVMGLDLGSSLQSSDFTKDLKKLLRLRNSVFHLSILETDAGAVLANATNALDFATRLIQNEWGNTHDKVVREVLLRVRRLKEFVQQRLSGFKETLEEAFFVLRCIECEQDAAIVDAGEVRCLFCTAHEEGSDYADFYSGGSQAKCPMCDEVSFVELPRTSQWGCFSCSALYEASELSRCEECDTLTEADHEYPLCKLCELRHSAPR